MSKSAVTRPESEHRLLFVFALRAKIAFRNQEKIGIGHHSVFDVRFLARRNQIVSNRVRLGPEQDVTFVEMKAKGTNVQLFEIDI